MELRELVRAAGKGDDEAFSQLMSLVKHKLYRIAYSYFRNEEDALEAVQEVVYRAYLKIGKLRQPQFFQTWIVRIMMNYCLTELKKRKRFLHRELKLSDTNDLQTEDMYRGLEKAEIEAAMEQMDPKYQTIIQLKYYHDLTISEIARTMDRPEGTIKSWLNKALAGLRKHFDKEGDAHV